MNTFHLVYLVFRSWKEDDLYTIWGATNVFNSVSITSLFKFSVSIKFILTYIIYKFAVWLAILKHLYLIIVFLSFPCWWKAFSSSIEGFWIRAGFLHDVRLQEVHPIYKISLSYPLYRWIIKGRKWPHTNTSALLMCFLNFPFDSAMIPVSLTLSFASICFL